MDNKENKHESQKVKIYRDAIDGKLLVTLFINSSNLREEIYVLSDYEFIVHQKEYIQTTEYIRVFVLHRKLEANKISVRRKAESTRFGEKKGFP